MHNGIIENYLELKSFLTEKGFSFISQTDTEVIAHLLEYYFEGDVLTCIRKVLNKLSGSYALGVLFNETPDVFYAVRKDSPLVVGLGENENFIASDMPALLKYTRSFILLADDEITCVSKDKVVVYNKNAEAEESSLFSWVGTPKPLKKADIPTLCLKKFTSNPKPSAIP